jgi:hypothetical protein
MKLTLGPLNKFTLGSRLYRSLRPNRLINPVHEWALGLGISAVLFFMLSGYLGYDFYIQYHRVDAPTTLDESITTYREKDVREVLETYRTRQAQFELLRKDRSIVVVPVLPPADTASTTNQQEVIPLAEEVSNQ